MAGAAFQGFLPIKVITIILPLSILAFDDFTAYLSMNREGRSKRLPCSFILANSFSDNIFCPLQSLLKASFETIERLGCKLLQRRVALLQDGFRTRLKSCFASHLCSSPALLLVGQINIFKSRLVPTFLNTSSKLGSQFSLSIDSVENELLTMLKLEDIIHFGSHLSHLNIRHSASCFLAITADEGHSSPILQQIHDLLHILLLEASSFGNQFIVHSGHFY